MPIIVHNSVSVLRATTVGQRSPETRDPWEQQAANELKAQIKRAGLGCADLAERLSAQDTPISAHGLAKKLHRGDFRYTFYLRCVDILEAAILASRRSSQLTSAHKGG
ncbi:MAG: hypothetical protein Tsb007_37560 [Rhizobacter sp.]